MRFVSAFNNFCNIANYMDGWQNSKLVCKSRHTVVCCVAQEASAPHNRKNNNVIFMHTLLFTAQTKPAVEMPTTVSTLHSTFQLNCARHFWDTNFKNWLTFFTFLFFLSSRCENDHKLEMGYPIALKFNAWKVGVRTHLDTTFDWNTINSRHVIFDYSQK